MSGNERGGILFASKAEDKFENRVAGRGVEISRGFIGEKDFGRIDKGASDGDALHLSARELVREAVFEAAELNGVKTA
jgi:hypothetical protein